MGINKYKVLVRFSIVKIQNGFECKQDCGGLPYISGSSENICVEGCSGTKFPYTDANLCVKECPKDARFYLESDKICAEKCQSGYFKASGSFACEQAPGPSRAARSVSFSNSIYKYLYPRATSYCEVKWNVPDSQEPVSVTAFLEAEGQLMYLRLNVATNDQNTKYAPVLFFAVHTVLSSELQLTAKVVANSVILAVVLLRDTKLFGSYVFGSFEDEGEYHVAETMCGHIAEFVQSVVDLNDGVRAEGIVQI